MQQNGIPQLMRRHLIAFVIVAVCLTVFSSRALLRAQVHSTKIEMLAEIGVEHTLPFSLSVDASNLQGVGIIDLQVESEEFVRVSVPSEWERREVRNVPLQKVTAEASSFGFTRWNFPPNASVSFGMPVYPSTLLLHNPSSIPVKTTVTQVDLDTGKVSRDVTLVQSSPVPLWD